LGCRYDLPLTIKVQGQDVMVVEEFVCQEDLVSLPSGILEKTTRSSPHYVAQHRPTGSETTPSYAPRSSRFGSEPPSVEDDVDVWRYAIVRVACQKRRRDPLLFVSRLIRCSEFVCEIVYCSWAVWSGVLNSCVWDHLLLCVMCYAMFWKLKLFRLVSSISSLTNVLKLMIWTAKYVYVFVQSCFLFSNLS